MLLALTNKLVVPPSTIVELEDEGRTIEPLAIGHLKRNCVRILGILAFDSEVAQDRMREAGGLGLLLGMCQISDSNPSKFLSFFLLGGGAKDEADCGG